MATISHKQHNAAEQLDATLEQFRTAALKQNRPWTLTVEQGGDGSLTIRGAVGQPEENKKAGKGSA